MISRYTTAVMSGTCVTVTLLFLMQYLISMEPADSPPVEFDKWHFLPTFVEEPVEPDILEPEFRDLTEPVEPDPRPQPRNDFDTEFGISVPITPQTPAKHDVHFGVGASDSPLVAFLRVEPHYPPRAEQLGLDGWVIVQFDVLPDGTVTNVSIVESSHRLFESAAIKAAKRFRYKAKVVDGVAQTTRGVRSRFRFEMERG